MRMVNITAISRCIAGGLRFVPNNQTRQHTLVQIQRSLSSSSPLPSTSTNGIQNKERFVAKATAINEADLMIWDKKMNGCKAAQDREAIMKQMLDANVVPSAKTWTTFMNGYDSAMDREAVFDRMQQANVQANVATWNVLMNGYKSYKNREKVMHRMKEAKIGADMATWNTLMKSYKSPKDREAVFERMKEASLVPDCMTWNTLMDSYNTSEGRETILKRMQEANIQATSATWNTLMSSYETSKDREAVLERMKRANCKVDSFTLNILLSSFLTSSEGSLKVIELYNSYLSQNSKLLNHYVAGSVIRAFVISNRSEDLKPFWKMCEARLGKSSIGWPGPFLLKQLKKYIRANIKNEQGSPWKLVSTLIEESALKSSGVGTPISTASEAEKRPSNPSLYLGNLSFRVTSDILKDMLDDLLGHGKYVDIKISLDPMGKFRGFAFVSFADQTSLENATVALQGVTLYDRNVVVHSSHKNNMDANENIVKRYLANKSW